MPGTQIVIPPPTKALRKCTPNLMPFHINYTGPAPISAFLRVKKFQVEEVEKDGEETEPTPEDATTKCSEKDATKNVEMTSEPPDDTGSELTPASISRSESQSTIVASESQTPSLLSSAASSSATLATTTPPPAPPPLEDADKRFVSSFRGRTIHGLTIDLPAGFGGLVLQTETKTESTPAERKTNVKGKVEKSSKNGKGKEKDGEEQEIPSTRRGGRLTRSALMVSKPAKPIEVLDEDVDVEMADSTDKVATAEDAPLIDDAIPTRNLVPTAQFSSFTLWQADRVVDKSRDEYYRSITEWIALANEIHHIN